MKKRIFFIVIELFMFGCLLNFISAATTYSYSICGNGILEAGEQCDGGKFSSTPLPNWATNCDNQSCTCPDHYEPTPMSFAYNQSLCLIRMGCGRVNSDSRTPPKNCQDPIYYYHDSSCTECEIDPDSHSCFCETHQKDPSCNVFDPGNRCEDSSSIRPPCQDGDLYCVSLDCSGSCPCRCPLNSDRGLDGAGACFCNPGFFSKGNVCTDTITVDTPCSTEAKETKCGYDILGKYFGNTCCASDKICLNSKCVTPPTPEPVIPPQSSAAVYINIGGGNAESRDIVCEATMYPQTNGSFEFNFRLNNGGESPKAITQEVIVAPPCGLLKPYVISVSYTFSRALTKNSGDVKCLLSYKTPAGPNSSESEYLKKDFDYDGSLAKQDANGWDKANNFDVDDWVFDDTYGDSTKDYICLENVGSEDYLKDIVPEILDKSQKCTVDNNNDGIGDYANCSYCRNPYAFEDADDIDNNGFGVCQANVGRPCIVYDYVGDGADDSSVTSVYDPSGKFVGFRGCGDIKNKFGVTDTFCQMVDDVPGMQNYQRAVKWGEVKGESETTTNSGQILTSYTFTSFKPGAVSNSFGIESLGGNLNIFSDLESLAVRCGSETVTEQSTPNSNPALEFQNVNVVYDKSFLFKTDGKNNEAKAKSRDTVGIEDQYIDSFRGECDFKKFWSDPITLAKLKEKDSSGNFIWQWQIAFVSKDKCNDGADNDGKESLFSAVPYGNYFSIRGGVANGKIFDEDTGRYIISLDSNPLSMNIPLIDVDDPQCKFTDSFYSEFSSYPAPLESSYYRTNPATTKPYCLDEDKDGYCGVPSGSSFTYNPSSSLSYSLDYSDEVYSRSKQFPDCDDSPADDSIRYRFGNTNKQMSTISSLGLFETYIIDGKGYGVGQPFGAWNVHPFAPVTTYSCFFGFDTNCNKNMEEGFDTFSLVSGDTPFDYDLSTGVEKVEKTFGFPSGMDLQCYYFSPTEQLVKNTVISSAYSIGAFYLSDGLSVIIPAAGRILAVLSVAKIGTDWINVFTDDDASSSDYEMAAAGTLFGILKIKTPGTSSVSGAPVSKWKKIFNWKSSDMAEKKFQKLKTSLKITKDVVNMKQNLYPSYPTLIFGP